MIFEEKSIFDAIMKMNLFCGGNFYVRVHPAGLLFLKNRHSWNFGTCSFCKNCTFCHFWSYLALPGHVWRRLRHSPGVTTWFGVLATRATPLEPLQINLFAEFTKAILILWLVWEPETHVLLLIGTKCSNWDWASCSPPDRGSGGYLA